MLTSTTKRYILPFSAQKRSAPEVEAATVFAISELERSKGGGFIIRQPEERFVFLSKVGYPLWLFPKNDSAFIFDGLDNSNFTLSYMEVPSAKAFLESLEANARPRENYLKFLSDHNNLVGQPTKEKHFTLRGLIADSEFRGEFSVYRKEAVEANALVNLPFLSSILDENAISSLLTELNRLQLALREDAQRLPECIRLVNKTTGQYMTELDYEASAAAEEIDAKIKAQEELTNPQITKLNKDYKAKIKNLTDNFDQELESLEKLKVKTEKFIEGNEEKIRQYEREAKAHGKQGHAIYEKRWKDKVKQTKKELDGLKKQLKKTESSFQQISKQKTQAISKLYFELDAEVKFAREPLLQLQAARDAKLLTFKRETEKLLAQEKPVIEGLNGNLRLREAVNANFEALTIKELQLKTPSLFYMPFYVACYEAGLSRRYLVIPPSVFRNVDFSAKLKGVLSMSKTKDALAPRFTAITALLEKLPTLIKQNSAFEGQLGDLGQKNNLLGNRLFTENAAKGLIYLKREGWLSERQQQDLNNRL